MYNYVKIFMGTLACSVLSLILLVAAKVDLIPAAPQFYAVMCGFTGVILAVTIGTFIVLIVSSIRRLRAWRKRNRNGGPSY